MKKHASILSTLLFAVAVALMLACQTWAVLTGEGPFEMLGIDSGFGRIGIGIGLTGILILPAFTRRDKNHLNTFRSL